MKQFLVYLAGPITGLSYAEATGWREYVRDQLPPHIQTLSPMRGKHKLWLSKETAIKDTYESDPLTSEKGINSRDFNDVKRSDLILVNLLGAKTISIGTVVEIGWAKAFGIPVVLCMEKGNIHDHAFVRYNSNFITEHLDHAIELVKDVLGPDEAVLEYKMEN